MGTETTKKKKSNTKRVRRLIVCMALALVLFCIIFAAYRVALRKGVEAEIQALRGEGYPTTIEELKAWHPPLPAEQNAASTYYKAFHRLGYEPEEMPYQCDLPALGEPIPEETLATIEKYLTDCRGTLDLLHEAGRYEQCRYHVDFDRPWLLPWHTMGVRRAARLLCWEVEAHAERGRHEGAARAIKAGISLAQSLRDEPLGFSQIIRNGCRDLYLYALERATSRLQFSNPQLRDLEEALADDDCESLSRAMAGDVPVMLFFFDLSHSEVEDLPDGVHIREGSQMDFFLYRFTGASDSDKLAYLRCMRCSLEAMRKAPPESLHAVRNIAREMKPFSSRCPMAFEPTPDDWLASELKLIARNRCARTALAVERYRLAQDELPADLAALVPEHCETLLLDPFSGRALRYKRLGDGYVIYSVGPDGQDNGGQPVIVHDEPYDIIFRVVLTNRTEHSSGALNRPASIF